MAVKLSPPSISDLRGTLPFFVAGGVALVLFWAPVTTLVRDWFNDPEASHGLLLAPLAVWLAWKAGSPGSRAGAAPAGAVA